MKESKSMMAKEVSFMKKKGAPKSMLKHEMAESKKYAKGGMPEALAKHAAKPASKAHAGLMGGGKVGYADGGMAMVMKGGKKVPAFAADGVGKMKSGGSVGTTKMGSVKTASKPDGVISKGGTKGTMVKMARGGKTC